MLREQLFANLRELGILINVPDNIMIQELNQYGANFSLAWKTDIKLECQEYNEHAEALVNVVFDQSTGTIAIHPMNHEASRHVANGNYRKVADAIENGMKLVSQFLDHAKQG